MNIVTSSNRNQQALLEQARGMRKDLVALGKDLCQLDNVAGVDSNPATGRIEFSDRAIDSAAIKGTFSGHVELEDGQLKLFRLFDAQGRSAAGYLAKEEAGWAKPQGIGLYISESGNQTNVSKSERIDPTTRSYRVKHALKNCATVVGSALATAVPLVGLGFFSMGQMFNDSRRDRGFQSLAMISHLGGVGALLLSAGDPAFLGIAGIGLGVSALAAGVLEARNTAGPGKEPFERSIMYSFPKD